MPIASHPPTSPSMCPFNPLVPPRLLLCSAARPKPSARKSYARPSGSCSSQRPSGSCGSGPCCLWALGPWSGSAVLFSKWPAASVGAQAPQPSLKLPLQAGGRARRKAETTVNVTLQQSGNIKSSLSSVLLRTEYKASLQSKQDPVLKQKK